MHHHKLIWNKVFTLAYPNLYDRFVHVVRQIVEIFEVWVGNSRPQWGCTASCMRSTAVQVKVAPWRDGVT